MEFTLPTSWGELTQQQLRTVLTLYAVLADQTDGMTEVKISAWANFCRVGIQRRTDQGWLCILLDGGGQFLLDPELMPSVLEPLGWLDHPEEMTVRIEKVGDFKAREMYLGDLAFGEFLALENYYQSYLVTREDECLRLMATILYGMTRQQAARLKPDILLGIFLWYGAAKKHWADIFCHFFKPAANGSAGTQEDQRESMNAQIRLLTKGDVTKNDQVLNTPLEPALAELDALAREAEEIKKKYGK